MPASEREGTHRSSLDAEAPAQPPSGDHAPALRPLRLREDPDHPGGGAAPAPRRTSCGAPLKTLADW